MILQRLKYNMGEDPLEMPIKYFSILSIMNDWNLQQREIQLLAFTQIHGNIGSDRLKRKFIEEHGSTISTLGNIISKLRKKHLFIKQGKREIVVNPAFNVDFSKNISLLINMEKNNILENEEGIGHE